MPPTEENLKELCNPAVLQRLLKTKRLPILWLVLRGLDLLSQRPEMAREIRALVPGCMQTLPFTNVHIALKLLDIFRNMLNHLGKRDASSFALRLCEKLLPLFSHVSCEVRERSILLFKDLMEAVVWWHRGSMKENVRRGLVPLLFRMSDEIPSVAQASRKALMACAKFLKWKELTHQAQEVCKHGIMKCLMQQSRRRVERHLWQSLPYLKNSQAALRHSAAEFIGLAVRHCWDQSEEKLNEICSALKTVEDDAHPPVPSLATELILMLRQRRRQTASSRHWLAALCCWPC
ncbi:MROH7 protein, partial [Odontophorus gujanensis]|nr:MROH7 protein [Odontophorus gujanensis]